jgi:uncharacterized membrane protein YesL
MNVAIRFNAISWVLLAFLLLNLALFDTMLPFVAFVLFTDSVAGLGAPLIVLVGVAAWTISVPGLAAAFAAYRDAPAMRFGETDSARDIRLARTKHVAAIADPYWSDAEDMRIVRPYLRNYARLFRRSITVAITFGVIIGAAVAAALGTVRLPGPLGIAVPALLFAFAAYALLAQMVALSMIVEFPRARHAAIVRNGFALSARGWRPSALGLTILVVYGYGLLHWPFLMLIFGTALVYFFLYHVAETIIRPVRELMIHEETPRNLPA